MVLKSNAVKIYGPIGEWLNRMERGLFARAEQAK
jgi:hypothetical protein